MTASTANDRFLVLAIDGGGVRGIVPAMLLQDLHRNAGLRFERIHLFAGTSAGSLTALGLAAGLSIDRIVSVYANPEDCRKIFTPNTGGSDGPTRWGCLGVAVALVERLVRRHQSGALGTINHLLNPRYTSTGFQGLIESLVQPVRLRDLKQKVFAPSLCLDATKDRVATWRPTAFHNLGKRSDDDGFGGHEDATIIDAVVASSSAPIDFPPHRYDQKLFVDGGTIANNPSALALSAAIGAGLIGDGGVPLDQVRLLSLGTGATKTVYPPADLSFPPPFGALGWMWPASRGAKGETPAVPLASALQDAVSQAADYQTRMMLAARHYRRVQLELGDDHIALDDANAVPDLERRTRALLASAAWERVRQWVREEFRA